MKGVKVGAGSSNTNIRQKHSTVRQKQSKEEVKDQELIQSNTTPNPGHHTGK